MHWRVFCALSDIVDCTGECKVSSNSAFFSVKLCRSVMYVMYNSKTRKIKTTSDIRNSIGTGLLFVPNSIYLVKVFGRQLNSKLWPNCFPCISIDPFPKRHRLVHNGGFPKLEALYCSLNMVN